VDGRESDDALAIYICWDCGIDFEVSEHEGLTDSLKVACPACGSDLVAVDFAAVRCRRPLSPRRPGGVGAQSLTETGEAC
jgi:DNA-directed RNA polymerase subunit RPC12/RpoP